MTRLTRIHRWRLFTIAYRRSPTADCGLSQIESALPSRIFLGLLGPAPRDLREMRAVWPLVNSAKHDGPELLVGALPPDRKPRRVKMPRKKLPLAPPISADYLTITHFAQRLDVVIITVRKWIRAN